MIQPKQLKQTNLDNKIKSQCPVCLERNDQENIFNFCQNNHKICHSCLKNYTQTHLSTSMKVIGCPHDKCQHIMTENSHIFTKISQNLQQKYKKMITTIQQMKKNVKYCPQCRNQLKEDSNNSNLLFCEVCKRKLCKECLNTAHEFRGKCQINVLFQLKINFRQCPNCRFIVQKSQGCDHMVCLCKHQFCYNCGKNRFAYTNHICGKNQRKYSE